MEGVDVLEPHEVTWLVTEEAARDVQALREELGAEEYRLGTEALREFLCEYFTAKKCVGQQGRSIAPLGGVAGGGKLLKVRWEVPGRGKSGGLRLAIVAFCEEKRVVLARAFMRRDNPSDADFSSAGELAEAYRELEPDPPA